MVEDADHRRRQDDDSQHGHEEDQRGVRGLPFRQRNEQPPGRVALRNAGTDQLQGDGAQRADHVRWQEPERDAPRRQPCEPRAFQDAGIVRMPQRLLARLAEEDDAEEFHHDVTRERSREGYERRAHGQQHVDERLRHFMREQERLEQHPLGDEAVQGR